MARHSGRILAKVPAKQVAWAECPDGTTYMTIPNPLRPEGRRDRIHVKFYGDHGLEVTKGKERLECKRNGDLATAIWFRGRMDDKTERFVTLKSIKILLNRKKPEETIFLVFSGEPKVY